MQRKIGNSLALRVQKQVTQRLSEEVPLQVGMLQEDSDLLANPPEGPTWGSLRGVLDSGREVQGARTTKHQADAGEMQTRNRRQEAAPITNM
eukprot:5661391-Amphidinium_carterae.1